ncbi:MAG: nuclear transport factor 2 family protein [Acidimicrobiales bacterium]
MSASPANPHFVAIERLVHAYTERVAKGDLDSIADLFVHGGVSGDAHPEPVIGRAAVLELYRTTLASSGEGPRRLRVVTTDLDVDIDEAKGTATCVSRFTVYPSDPTITDTVLFVGRYLDQFAQFDGAWAFTRRHVALDVTNHEAVEREGVNLG